MTRELHTYLGPAEAPLFGALHLPTSGQVRGTALICPPLGKEHFDTVRGLRLLADELAGVGIAALRLDYYCTGDSAYAAERDDAVELWTQSVRLGLDYLRALVSPTAGGGGTTQPPAVVALRAGALIATHALASGAAGAVGPVVLWDPVARGRAYLREQRALFAMTVGNGPGAPAGAKSDTVPLIGTVLTEAAAAALSRLSLDPQAVGSAPRWLLAARPDSQNAVLDTFADAADPDRLVAAGMPEFVQAPGVTVKIPGEVIGAIRGWLDAATPRSAAPVSPVIRDSASFENPDGVRVVERIEQIGEHRLFAIRSFPQHSDAGHDPGTGQRPAATKSALFHATANDTHHGPNRAWVSLSREVAAAGAQALRFDRRGAGETLPARADERLPVYSQDAVDDSVAAASATGRAADVIAVGVCSGAWLSAAAARARRADTVVLINEILWSWRFKRAAEVGADNAVARSDPAFQNSFRGRVKSALRRWLPYPGWRLLGKLGITQVPEVLLRPLTEAGVNVTTILSPHDADWFDSQRGLEGMRRLRTAPPVIRTGVGDHTAYHPAVRAAIRAVILEWCTRTDALKQLCPAHAGAGND